MRSLPSVANGQFVRSLACLQHTFIYHVQFCSTAKLYKNDRNRLPHSHTWTTRGAAQPCMHAIMYGRWSTVVIVAIAFRCVVAAKRDHLHASQNWKMPSSCVMVRRRCQDCRCDAKSTERTLQLHSPIHQLAFAIRIRTIEFPYASSSSSSSAPSYSSTSHTVCMQ